MDLVGAAHCIIKVRTTLEIDMRRIMNGMFYVVRTGCCQDRQNLITMSMENVSVNGIYLSS